MTFTVSGKAVSWYNKSLFVYSLSLIFFALSLFFKLIDPGILFKQCSFIIIFVGGIHCAYLADKKTFKLLITDMRWLRVSHYVLMLILGIVIAESSRFSTFFATSLIVKIAMLTHFVLILISILLAALFSIITNNIADQAIDQVCNKTRPLVTGVISLALYVKIAIVALFGASFFAGSVSKQALCIILMVMGIYYIYSMPPLRFKRIPIFSKLAISTNSLLLIMLGYQLIANTIDGFPSSLIPIFLIGFTLSANFIDLKDYHGDLIGGIKTLPVLIGPKNAALIIGSCFLGTYLAFYFFLNNILLLPLLLSAGLVQFYFINKKPYKEKIVFLIYLSNLIGLIILIILGKYTMFIK